MARCACRFQGVPARYPAKGRLGLVHPAGRPTWPCRLDARRGAAIARALRAVMHGSAGRPLTLAHSDQSLDGYIATASGDSYYVTGPDNVRHLHRLRALCGRDRRRRRHRRARRSAAHGAPRRRHEPGSRRARSVGPTRCTPPRIQRRRRADARRACRGRHCAGAGQLRDSARAGQRRRTWARRAARAAARARVVVRVRRRRRVDGVAISRSRVARSTARRDRAARDGLRPGGFTLPARERIADCLRPAHRVFAMGGDVLFDCDLRASAPPATGPSGALDARDLGANGRRASLRSRRARASARSAQSPPR